MQRKQCALPAVAFLIAYMLQALLWDVLLPTSTVIICWDMIMLTLIIYLAIVIPYAVAFSISFVSNRDCAASALFTGWSKCLCLPSAVALHCVCLTLFLQQQLAL